MDVLNNNCFLILVGLPASGKTIYGLNLAKRNNCLILDDPQSINDILNFISKENKGIICDPLMCLKSMRDDLIKKSKLKFSNSKKIKFIYFENNPNKCLINDLKRNKQANLDILYFSSLYHIPKNSNVLKIYSKKSHKNTF